MIPRLRVQGKFHLCFVTFEINVFMLLSRLCFNFKAIESVNNWNILILIGSLRGIHTPVPSPVTPPPNLKTKIQSLRAVPMDFNPHCAIASSVSTELPQRVLRKAATFIGVDLTIQLFSSNVSSSETSKEVNSLVFYNWGCNSIEVMKVVSFMLRPTAALHWSLWD